MTLPGKIVLRPNEFSQPDYDVIYKDPDGLPELIALRAREWSPFALLTQRGCLNC